MNLGECLDLLLKTGFKIADGAWFLFLLINICVARSLVFDEFFVEAIFTLGSAVGRIYCARSIVSWLLS
jgi:hypothetical protein